MVEGLEFHIKLWFLINVESKVVFVIKVDASFN